jgi:hypothetical protein
MAQEPIRRVSSSTLQLPLANAADSDVKDKGSQHGGDAKEPPGQFSSVALQLLAHADGDIEDRVSHHGGDANEPPAPQATFVAPPVRAIAAPRPSVLRTPPESPISSRVVIRTPPESPIPSRVVLRTPPESPSGWASYYAATRSGGQQHVVKNISAQSEVISVSCQRKSRIPTPIVRGNLSPAKPGGGGYSSPAHLQFRRHQLFSAAPPSPTPPAMAAHSNAIGSRGGAVAQMPSPIAGGNGRAAAAAVGPQQGKRTGGAGLSRPTAPDVLQRQGSQDLSGFEDGEWEAAASAVGRAVALSEGDGTEMPQSSIVGTPADSPHIISPCPETVKPADSSDSE